MATLLESPEKPLSLDGVAEISQKLARDISRLVLRTEGFTVEEYFTLDGPYFVEYRDGSLQILPMPNALHQALAFIFANMLVAWSKPDRMARTKLAPFRVRVSEQEYREPDVCFMTGANADRRRDEFWIGADLVVEIISESNRRHDYEQNAASTPSLGSPSTGSSIRSHGWSGCFRFKPANTSPLEISEPTRSPRVACCPGLR